MTMPMRERLKGIAAHDADCPWPARDKASGRPVEFWYMADDCPRCSKRRGKS